MPKVARPVDRARLENALEIAERNGPLSSRDKLWETVAIVYNGDDATGGLIPGQPPVPITKAVARSRTLKLNIPVRTQEGEPGRPFGAKDGKPRKVTRTKTLGLSAKPAGHFPQRRSRPSSEQPKKEGERSGPIRTRDDWGRLAREAWIDAVRQENPPSLATYDELGEGSREIYRVIGERIARAAKDELLTG